MEVMMAEFRGKLKAPAAIINAGINKLRELGRVAEAETFGKDLPSDGPEVVGRTVVLPDARDKDIESLNEVFTDNGYKGPGLNMGRLGDIFDGEDILIDATTLYKGMKKMDLDVDDPSSYDFLNQLKAQNIELFEFARRGKMSIEDMTKLANKMGLFEITKKTLMRKPGEMMKPEELLGGLLMMKRLSDEAKYGASSLLKRKADGTISPEEFASEYKKFQKLRVIAENLSAQVSGGMSEAGRSLAVASHAQKVLDTDTRLGIGGNYGPSMDMQSVSATNQILSELEEKEALYDLAVVATLPSRSTPDYLLKTATYGRKTIDFMMEAYINSLLSSPVTHTVNIAGNSAFQLTRLAETGVAGVIGNIRRDFFGASDDRAMLIEAQAFMHGSLMAQKDAFKLMARTMVTGESGDLVSKLDIRELALGDTNNIVDIMEQVQQGNLMPAFINTMGIATRLPGRFLAAEDEYFKVMIRRRVRYQEAYRAQHIEFEKRLSAGFSQEEAQEYATAMYAKYLDDPPPDVLKREREVSLKETFQSPIKAEGAVMGPVAQGGNALFNNHVAKILGVPFFKTPTNIFKEVADRSINVYPTMKALIKGEGREFDEALSKLITGWGVMGSMVALTSGYYGDDIIVTGTGPGNRKARAIYNKGANVPSTSIGIKQDDGTYKFTSFNRFDPISMLLVAAADYNNFVEYNQDADLQEKLLNSLLMVTMEYSSNVPFMQGLAEMQEILGNRYEDADNRGESLMRYLGRRGAGFATAVGGQVESSTSLGLGSLARNFVDYPFLGSTSFQATLERLSDPFKSNTMLTDDQINSMRIEDINPMWRGWLEVLNQSRARHPLFASGTYDDVNFWNEPIMQMDEEQLRKNGKLVQSFNPIRIQTGAYDQVDLELMRLSQLGFGEFSYHPRKVAGYALTAEEYLTYVDGVNNSDADGNMPGDDFYDVNMTLRNRLYEIVADGNSDVHMEYMGLPDEEKIERLKDILGDHRDAAKMNIMTTGRLDKFYRIDNPESNGYSLD